MHFRNFVLPHHIKFPSLDLFKAEIKTQVTKEFLIG